MDMFVANVELILTLKSITSNRTTSIVFLATDADNGFTLCRNCHARLKGKEERTHLLTVIKEVTGQHDSRTADQLQRLNSKFCNYLDSLLDSENPDTRNNVVDQLDIQLSAYPDSLNQFLSLIRYRLDTENGSDGGFAGRMATEFLVRYYKGEAVIENDREAAEWFHEAAQQGRATMQTCLGWMYHHALMVKQNDEEAVKWFQKAAEQGNATAQYILGVAYTWGLDVEQDHEEAVKWFQKAAEQGNATAQYILGVAYAEGKGVEQDYKEAVKWFQKAAEQGHAEAQENLRRYCTGASTTDRSG